MTTDLENRIRDALVSRGDTITAATLRRTARPVEHAGEDGIDLVTRAEPRRRPTGVVELRKPARYAVTWVSVAAVVTLIATAAALVISANDRPSSLDGAAPPPVSAGLLRSLHFAIALPAGYRITQALLSADGTQDVQITSPGNHNVWMSVDPPAGAGRRFTLEARPITVAGRPGFIGRTWTAATVDSKTGSSAISWKYNDVAYAVFVTSDLDRASLLALARRIDFSKRTPVRVATSIRVLPAGTRLAAISSTYDDVAPDAAYPWDSTIVLSLDSSPRDAIRIELCRCASGQSARREAARRTAERQTVNGKTAYVYPNGAGGADVEVDEGHGVVLHVTSSHDEGGQWTGRTSTLLELARSITVTPHPNRPATWFAAATAIP